MPMRRKTDSKKRKKKVGKFSSISTLHSFTKVKLMGKTYRIVQLSNEDMDELLGQCIYHKQIIKVNRQLAFDMKLETIQHEIFHAILAELGIKINTEEELVRSLSCTYFGFLRDNPKIARRICNVSERKRRR